MGNKTSEKDFVYFRERVQYWVEMFSLGEYEVTCTHRDLEEEEIDKGKTATAFINVDVLGKGAEVCLAKDWGMDTVNKKDLDRAALHEIVHLLLYEYHEGLLGRLPPPVIEAMEHAIVRRVENYLLGPSL